MPLLALHRRFVLGNDKMATAPDLSLRGRSAPVAISGRHSQPVQAAVKMEKAEIWGVAALTAQPLAALPPYGCGVPFTGSERLVQGGNVCGTNSLVQCLQVCHCEEAAGRRGNLSSTQSDSGKASANSRAVTGDSHVASLLGMTNLIALRCRITAAIAATAYGAHYPQGVRRIRKAAKPPTAAQ